jgi:glycerol kinase
VSKTGRTKSGWILAIDQGTTGTKAVIVDRRMGIAAEAAEEFPQHYPRPGLVEHDPEEIWASVRGAVRAALRKARLDPAKIGAIGITNQRETTVLWEASTGRPVGRAIVWQDRRTAPECEALKARGLEGRVREKTGLVLDPYFSGTKIAWILDNVRGARRRAERGELRFGTVDSYLLWRLTGGRLHATDVSNASRTLLLDLGSCSWDEEMLRLFRIPREVLPEVRSNDEILGATRGLDFLPNGIPLAGPIGDQQSALFGQACFRPGEAKCTYGTGAFLLVNAGPRPPLSRSGLLATAAWRLGRATTYALEGSVFIAGAAVQWLRDGLGIIGRSADVEALAASVPDADGVVLVPAFTGLGAPRWRPAARGLIAGITRGTTRAHIARAALEGIAFQCGDVLKAMEEDAGRRLREIKVDGGAAANDLLLQFQADILGRAIVRPRFTSTTALGAAFLAGLAVGLFRSLADIRSSWAEDRRFVPAMPRREAAERIERWRAAVEKA